MLFCTNNNKKIREEIALSTIKLVIWVMKKRIILVFSVLVIFVATLCSCDSINMFSNEYKVSQYVDAEKYQTGNFSYLASEVERIDIDWGPRDITIIQSDSDQLKVEETGNIEEDDEKLHYLIENKVLKIQFWKSLKKAVIKKNTKDIVVEIPYNVYLKISSISGDLKADKLVVDFLEYHSTSGDIC